MGKTGHGPYNSSGSTTYPTDDPSGHAGQFTNQPPIHRDTIPLKVDYLEGVVDPSCSSTYTNSTYTDKTPPKVSNDAQRRIREALKRYYDFVHLPGEDDTYPDIERLYYSVREAERKPSHFVFGAGYRDFIHNRPFPSISSEDSLKENVQTKVSGPVVDLLLGEQRIASYSPNPERRYGKVVYMEAPDLSGRLYLNPAFFRLFDLAKKNSDSDIRNIAKAFFEFSNKNHVALVQYLPSDGVTREHYHSLDEVIVQLAGRSFIELRPITDDSSPSLLELNQGDVFHIPPEHLHVLFAKEKGSITVPIKQTINKRSDHLTIERSEKRIAKELDLLAGDHYESGRGMEQELRSYVSRLNPEERKRLKRVIRSGEFRISKKMLLEIAGLS